MGVPHQNSVCLDFLCNFFVFEKFTCTNISTKLQLKSCYYFYEIWMSLWVSKYIPYPIQVWLIDLLNREKWLVNHRLQKELFIWLPAVDIYLCRLSPCTYVRSFETWICYVLCYYMLTTNKCYEQDVMKAVNRVCFSQYFKGRILTYFSLWNYKGKL